MQNKCFLFLPFWQVLSTLSKGLFHKAILESGVLIPSNKDLLLSADLKVGSFLHFKASIMNSIFNI